MRFSYSNRLTSVMTPQQLTDTALASMTELLAALDSGVSGVKRGYDNFHPNSRFHGSQLGTVKGSRLGLDADGKGVDETRMQPGSVDQAARASGSLDLRALYDSHELFSVAKTGLLRGSTAITLTAGNATGSQTINWTSDSPPTVFEQIPAGWTTPLLKVVVKLSPYGTIGGNPWDWNSHGANLWVSSTSDTGFVVNVHSLTWNPSTHVSSDYTTGTRVYNYRWIAAVNYS